MARVLFLSDFEQGHLFPTFGLAQSLVRRGHRVDYIGIPDMEPVVRAQGFDFHPIFADVYPAGEPARLRAEAQAAPPPANGEEAGRLFTRHLEPLIAGDLDPLISSLDPDVIVSSLFLTLETLIFHFRYERPMAVLTPCLRLAGTAPEKVAIEEILDLDHLSFQVLELAMSRGHEVRSMEQLVEPLAAMPELLACPRELDLPGIERGSAVHHIEASIRAQETLDTAFPWAEIPLDEKLIVVSLGSQTEVYLDAARTVLGKLLALTHAAAAAGERWHFVVSLPEHFDADELGGVSDNVTLCRWLPQLELLERAELMIGHGGLGTVKECAYHGVPMLVLPLSRDQPDNARRVEHHRIGVAQDPATATAESLLAAVRRLLADAEIAEACARMSEVFRRAEREQRGARLLEAMIDAASLEQASPIAARQAEYEAPATA